ncbi:hypothetical protein HNY73_017642 [Argiope bruennichi]|uniref:Uncharacterized protein n=1 Tax=Argiope bruennichi TaxID=94029 RepID=A0A8T0EBB1_ARGBR|nr:hypothetical protein HNY73_017642 [Argiope bruennichi]
MHGQHMEILAVYEKQEANREPTASHGELPRLSSMDERIKPTAEGLEAMKHKGSKDRWEPRYWDTRTHLK